MLTILRMRWAHVDDSQWEQLRILLNTRCLAADGCMSWHCRRFGGALHVSALWDDQYAAQVFLSGRLIDAVEAVGLDRPDLTRVTLPGMFSLGQRPAA